MPLQDSLSVQTGKIVSGLTEALESLGSSKVPFATAHSVNLGGPPKHHLFRQQQPPIRAANIRMGRVDSRADPTITN